jgi:hypothetical protein
MLNRCAKSPRDRFLSRNRHHKTSYDTGPVSVFITAVPITKLFASGEVDSGGHVLRETTSRGLCGLVCPSHTSERGGKGDCVKEGGGEEGERERARALWLLLCHSPRH